MLPAGLEGTFELVAVRIPGSPPDGRNDYLTVQEHPGVTGIVEQETIDSGLGRLDVAVEHNVGAIEIEILRSAVHLKQVRLDEIFLVEGRLAADESLPFRRLVHTGESAFFAVAVIESEDLAELGIVARITPAAETVTVPKYAVALAGYDERH